ncbi:hypothetical protein [Natronorubrum sp. FCH18a]|uniref:hypothetical protein n=1 Tax=Natronorubrum sp. FCH18a TaxID=3447018 RepID=UPI003F517D02
MTTIDAITLIDRDDGTRSMKLGRHDGDTYLEEQAIKTESAEIVELEDPVSKATILANWATSDFPERVREFFDVDKDGTESEDDGDGDQDFVDCVLCDESSSTETEHNQHMEAVHNV